MVTSEIEAALQQMEPGTDPADRRFARFLPLTTTRGYRTANVVELRDPNTGRGDPECAVRHQYTVAGGVVWRRLLPPAPLAIPPLQYDPARDEWLDDRDAARWERWTPPFAAAPVLRVLDRLAQATGRTLPALPPDAIRMGPGSWAAITNVPCPVEGCRQRLVWAEANTVPGYRVCQLGGEGAGEGFGGPVDPALIGHRFTSFEHGACMVLRPDASY